jgi:hypothetical protein
MKKLTKKTANASSKAHTSYKLADGTRVPGVTTITGILAKPALVKWANRLGLDGYDVEKYVDDKAAIGTLAHAIVTDFLSGKTTDFNNTTPIQRTQAENAALSFFNWLKGHKVAVEFVEKPMVSEQYRFGGTCDIYANVDGKWEIIDLKTGSGIWPEYFIQTSAYRQLVIESGKPVDQIRILNIPRTESETWLEAIAPVPDKQFEVFRHCLEVYRLRKQLNNE